MTLHYIEGESFRVEITNLEEVKTNSLLMELEFDKESFNKTFEFIDEKFKDRRFATPAKQKEVQLKSLKMVNKNFVDRIMTALIEFEH